MSESSTPSATETWLLRFGTAGALVAMLGRGKRWWMVPLVLVLLLVSVGLLFLTNLPYLAPFIYMVF